MDSFNFIKSNTKIKYNPSYFIKAYLSKDSRKGFNGFDLKDIWGIFIESDYVSRVLKLFRFVNRGLTLEIIYGNLGAIH